MKFTAFFFLLSSAQAFAPSVGRTAATINTATTSLFATPSFANDNVNRRGALKSAAAFTAASILAASSPLPALAADTKTVFVAGATGQTGRRILEKLASTPGLQVVGGVRSVEKATKSLSESSTVVRGAMVQKVASVDTASVDLRHLDVVKDSVEDLVATLKGADALVIATGFIPGNPLKMNEAAHQVDNEGTIRLVDAAKQAGVKKIVMVSSILTDGGAWGQLKSPGYVVTNAFGNVLVEKLAAEKYLRASGMDYTIVRPGGLKAKPPAGSLVVSGENTLNAGEISRDLVADVCVASLSDPKASNKVLEIVEDEGVPFTVFNGLKM
jgi:nucleoside-diphosphate-sugar epimerase